MQLLICAGGTGGGVYPAAAVLQALGNKADAILWVGGEGGIEADLVQRIGVDYQEIPAAGLHGVGLRALPGNLWKLLRGTLASRRILRAFQPDVLLFTGGYLAVPMALAGRRIPTLLYVPDIEPGLALKFLSRFADCIGLTAPDSRAYFPAKHRMEVTGYPTRSDLAVEDKSAARRTFNLNDDLPVLLVFGGSKGARSINRALMAILPELLTSVQVLHISGRLDWAEVENFRNSLPKNLQAHYRPIPYLHKMGSALSSANLVISRAGAATLGEFPLFGLPAILVPYPHAWRYQKVNADFLTAQNAAVLLKDENLNTDLLPTIQSLLASPEKMNAMQRAMRNLAHPDAADRLAELVQELAKGARSRTGGIS